MLESTTEVQNAVQKALQAFQEMEYPVTKMQLIEEAKKLNAPSEVIKTFEACSDREYTNFSDVMHPQIPENDKC
jgi:hypothetical protein